MSRLYRRENAVREEIPNGETETTKETLQVEETNEPEILQVSDPVTIVTGGQMSSGDKVQLKCSRCEKFLEFTRNIETNLLCPQCGSDKFLALCDFRMEGPNGGIAISKHDQVSRRDQRWKLV